MAVFASTGNRPEPNDDNLIPEGLVEIVNALPNPTGDDTGREPVTLAYLGEDSVSIAGWSLWDKAGNIYTFPSDSTLDPGSNEFILEEHTMPLNNNGDTITLLDRSGVQRDPLLRYSREDVSPGVPVR